LSAFSVLVGPSKEGAVIGGMEKGIGFNHDFLNRSLILRWLVAVMRSNGFG